ncbi:MAG: hypothetical protein JWN64_315 [Parcubacteria group bacterium]|nr:hypothetical protein [Parcubacteria group bacterium]
MYRILFIFLLATTFSVPFFAAAEVDSVNPGNKEIDSVNPGPSTGLQNPLKNINNLNDLLNVILSAVIEIGTIVLVLMLVYTGFKFVLAQGNAEELKNARSMLIWTVIGGLILLGAQAISAVIQATANTL